MATTQIENNFAGENDMTMLGHATLPREVTTFGNVGGVLSNNPICHEVSDDLNIDWTLPINYSGTTCSTETRLGEIFFNGLNNDRIGTPLLRGSMVNVNKRNENQGFLISHVNKNNEHIIYTWNKMKAGCITTMVKDLVPQSWFNIGFDETTHDKVDSVVDAINRITGDMKADVNVKLDIKGLVKIYIVLALATSALLFAHKRSYFLALLSSVGIVLIEGPEMVQACKEYISLLSFSAQGDFDVSPLINFALVTLGLNKLSKGQIKEFSTIASNYSKISDGGQNMFHDSLKFVEILINFIRDKVMGLDRISLVDDVSEEMQVWIDDIDKIQSDMDKNSFNIDVTNYDKLLLLRTLGDRYLKEISKAGKEYLGVKSIVLSYQKKIVDLIVPFKKASLDASCLRAPPLAILLQGQSGVGKSAVTIPLLDHLLIGIMEDPDTLKRYLVNNMDFIYSRNYETKYWDGYRGQMVCVFDDFMQNVESSSDPDGEPMNVIRAINPFPYQLHMAHLDDKGNNYFSSKIVLATTNDFNLHSLLIKQPEALKRRFEVQLEVYPKVEYCIDPSVSLRDRRLKHMSDFSLDVYEFHVKTDKHGVAPKPVLDFIECVEFLRNTYDLKMNGGTRYLDKISSHRASLISDKLSSFNAQGLDNFLVEFRAKGIMDKYMTPERQQYYRREINFLLGSKLCYYDKPFMAGFWKSLAGRSYLIDVHDPVDKMDEIDKKVLFRQYFKRYCDKNNCGCTIPVKFENNYKARYVDPQDGDNHSCHLNFESFIARFSELAQPNLSNDEILTLCAAYLNCGNVCDCRYMAQAAEMLGDYEVKSGFDLHGILGKIKQNISSLASYPVLVGIAGVIATIKTVQVLHSMWFSESCKPQYGEGKKSSGVRSLKSFHVTPVSPQGGDIPSGNTEFASSLLKKNVYVAFVGGNDVPWAYFTAVKNDIFMVNAHYYHCIMKRINSGKPIEACLVPYVNVVNKDSSINYHINLCNLVKSYPPTKEMLDNDVWLFSISNMRPHRDITKSFIDFSELKNYSKLVPINSLFLRDVDDDIRIGAVISTRAEVNYSPIRHTDISLTYTLKYTFPSEAGDCGSLVLLNDMGYGKDKIVAMHAGLASGAHAIATIITRELMTSLIEKFQDNLVVLPRDVDPDMIYDENGLLLIENPHIYHRPVKSKLRKSPLHGLFGDAEREPAVLTVRDGIDPYSRAIERYGTGNFHVDEHILQCASDHYSHHLRNVCSGSRRILSFDEAVAGIAGEPYINGVCRKTSPGYPWNLNGTGGKWHIFGAEDIYDLDRPNAHELRDRCDLVIGNARLGLREKHYYIDALKDELRSREKIINCKTRMISCAPLDLVVVMKMYFGSFVSSFIKNRIFNGSAVGINPVSHEWGMLYKHVMSKGGNVIAGDFSNFDATQSSTTLRKLCDIINEWYDDGPENKKIREILWLEVYNSLHLHGQKAVMFDHSLPSGNPLTTIINTMYVNVVFRMAFVHCFDNSAVLSEFDNHVSLVGYGDDNILGVSDEALEFFNYITIEESMSRLGLIYTNEDKTSITKSCKSISECTFLKRSFRQTEFGIVAPLDLRTVVEMSYWYRNGPGVDDRIVDNVTNSLKELALHDPVVWSEYSSKIFSECEKMEIPVINMNQSYYFKCGEVDYVDDINNRILDGIVAQSGEENELSSKQIAGSETGTVAANDATVFLSDTIVREYEPAPTAELDSLIRDIPQVFDQNEVKKFLARPIKIGQFSFANTNAAGDTLYSHQLPPSDFYTSVTPLWAQKISGFLGVRGTAVFRFVIAVNRFAQGRLVAHYLPGVVDSDWEKQHNRDLCTRTQQPRIDINVNRDTSAEIKFPYISPSTHYNVLTGEGYWGKIFVTAYSPLLGYTGSINVSVFLHFEDVELVLPTYVVPQAGDFREKEARGPISGPLGSLQKAAMAMAEVPLLRSIATPAAWFLDAAKQIASSFGYASANNEDHMLRVSNLSNPYSLNNDGQRVAIPLSHSSRNKVDVLPGFASNDVDEMSLRYFASRSAYVTHFTLSTSDASGDVMFNNNTAPFSWTISKFSRVLPLNLSGTAYTMPPVTFLTLLSSYWRGSLVYTFKLVKTEFHTGKLAIVFYPGRTDTSTIDKSNWTFRHIVDIKETDEFHVTVPYTALTPWLAHSDGTGMLTVYTVNPLNAPSSVPSTVDVLVEVSGGDDFAVAGMRDVMASPMTDSTFTPQSGMFSSTRIEKFVIGDAEVKSRNLNAERFCIGEAMTSVKHYVNKFTRCLGPAASGYSILNTPTKLTLKPYTIGGSLTDATTVSPGPISGDFVSLFSACYSLGRGGMYYSFRSNAGSISDFSLHSEAPGAASAPFVLAINATGAVSFPLNEASSVTSADSQSDNKTVLVPQWSKGHSRYIRCDNTNGSRSTYPFEPANRLTIFCPVNAITMTQFRMFRAAADDYGLGGFVGVPMIYVYAGASNPASPDYKG